MEIIKEALHPFAQDQLPQDGDGQVSLSYARGADKEQAKIRRIFLDKILGIQLRPSQALVIPTNIKILKGAVLISFWNVHLAEQKLGALHVIAVAPGHPPDAVDLHWLPARSLALGAVFSRYVRSRDCIVIHARR